MAAQAAQQTGDEAAQEAADRVTTLELFFDLVFVFMITQITERVLAAQQALDYYAAFLVLAITWWMYGGYAWLTNNLRLRQRADRLLLLSGMGAFLAMALAIPHAFDQAGLFFGLAYLVVVTVHAGLFTHAMHQSSKRAIWRIAPYNLATAGLLVVAGLVGEPWKLLLWTLALGVLIASTLLRRERGFVINAAHFAERHGLVVLIVLGESLIAFASGAAHEALELPVLGAALLGLALSAALWWSYFDRDDTSAERAMHTVDDATRARKALQAYGYAHVPIIAGIVVMAAGVRQVINHLAETPVPASAWHMGGGVALYLLGDVLFRRIMGIGHGWQRWLGCALALASIPLGIAANGLWQIVFLTVMLVGMLALEARNG
jgi:low temperature requirement protein LtrA